MATSGGFFDADDRPNWLSTVGEPAGTAGLRMNFELYRQDLQWALRQSETVPYDAVLMLWALDSLTL